MPKLPGAEDFGMRPTPRPSRPMFDNSSVAAGYQRAADLQTKAADDAGAEFKAIAESVSTIAAVEQKMRAGQETVDRTKLEGEFVEGGRSELRRLEGEGDLSNPETARQYRQFLNDRLSDVLNRHGGSWASRQKLETRLIKLRTSLSDEAAEAAFQESSRLMEQHLGDRASVHAAAAAESPASLSEIYAAIDDDIDNMADAIPPHREHQYRNAMRQQATASAVGGFLDRADWRGAKALLNDTPGIREALTPEAQRELDSRISTFERKFQDAQLAGQAKVAELKTILGREPTMAERVRAAGVAPPEGKKTATQKIREIEDALDRQLSEDERARVLEVSIDPAKLTDQASMRKEFTKLSEDFVVVRDSFNRITGVAEDPSAAGDIALVFSFMKVLDPNSVVRESEFATAANAGGVPDRVRAVYNRVLSGERLAPEQRADFVQQARVLMNAQLKTQKQLEGQFTEIARRSGIDPANVVVDFASADEQGAMVPTPSGPPRIQYDLEGNRIGQK